MVPLSVPGVETAMFLSRRSLLLWFANIVWICCLWSSVSQAQASYRTLQSQTRPPQDASGQPIKSDADKASFHRFFGWKYAAKAGGEYQSYFQRPRAGLARLRMVTDPSLPLPSKGQTASHPPTGSQSFPALALRPTDPSGFIPDSIATADFNGDGNTDWVVANGGDNDLWVYPGNGDGTSATPVILNLLGLGPSGVATADLRGTGKMDIIVAEADSSTIEVFLGNGDGTFQSSGLYSVSGIPTYVAVADFNKDGHPDLALTMFGQSPVAVLLGVGDGTFGAPILDTWGNGAPALISLSVADINNDGNLDLVYVDLNFGVGIALGNGHGGLSTGRIVVPDNPYVQYLAAAAGDVNEDGCQDIVATDPLAFAEIYTGNCNGTFASNPQFQGIGDIGVSVALRDMDGDGHLDIVAAGDYVGNILGSGDDAGNLLSISKGNGQGGFAAATVFRGEPGMYSLAFASFGGVSVPSVLAVNEDVDSITIFKNDGTADFGEPRGRAIGYQGGTSNSPYGGFIPAEVNGDHLPDFLNIDVPQYSPGNYQLSTILNQGNGKFSPAQRSVLFPDALGTPGDFAAGDFRNTGHPDVIAVGQISTFAYTPFVAFAANNGSGNFAQASLTYPSGGTGIIGVGDFNRDGKLDFVTISGTFSGSQLQSFNVFLGNGDGTFAAQPTVSWGGTNERWPIAVYVGDFNADGLLDVMVYLYDNVVPYSVNDIYVFYGNGDGIFQAPAKIFSNSAPFSLIDVNNDGIPDIVTCQFELADYPSPLTPASTSVMLGLSTGGFGPPATYATYPGYSLLADVISNGPGLSKNFCPVGDFNGDGNLDIGVTEAGSFNPWPSYVQFLTGNGDGTFTPTYNIYSFGRRTIPQKFYDLDGDGKTDLLELDGLTSSFNFIPGSTAKAFQLETVTEPITGNVGAAQVSLDVVATSDTVFELHASDPGLQLPATVTVPAGSISQQFSYTVTDESNLHQVFKISAVLGSEQEDTYNFVLTDHRVQTGFVFSLSSNSLTVFAGYSTSDYGPGYSAQSNYETALQFSCSGLPSGATCDFEPPSAQLGPGEGRITSMFIRTTADTVPGTYPFQATASDSNSSISYSASVTIYPPSPNIIVSAPASVSGPVGAPMQVQFTVTNNGDAPATDTVATASFFPPAINQTLTGLTSSVGTCSLTTQSCNLGTVNVGDVITVTSTFVPLNTSLVGVALAVTESQQDINPNDNQYGTAISVVDYSLTLSPSSLNMQPGSQGTVAITLQALYSGNFSLPVTLTCSGLPSGASCSFVPATVTPGTGQASAVLTVSVPTTLASSKPQKRQCITPWFGLWFAPFGLVGLLPGKQLRSRKWLLLAGLLMAGVFILQACGGSGSSRGSSGSGSTPSTYTVKVGGNASGDQHSASLTLNVQ